MGEGTSVLASAHAVEKHSQNIFPPVCVVRVMRSRCGAEVRGEPINRSASPTGALPAWLPPALGIHTLLALFPPQSLLCLGMENCVLDNSACQIPGSRAHFDPPLAFEGDSTSSCQPGRTGSYSSRRSVAHAVWSWGILPPL